MQWFCEIESNQFQNGAIDRGTIERDEFKLVFKNKLAQADRRCTKKEKGTLNRRHISPSIEHPQMIFRMDWLDLLAVQGTLKSLLQHHSSKASIIQCSAFFIVQHSYSYMSTGKIIALTRQTFVDKAMSLLFNMLSRLLPT